MARASGYLSVGKDGGSASLNLLVRREGKRALRPRFRVLLGLVALLFIGGAAAGFWFKTAAGLKLTLAAQPQQTAQAGASVAGAPGGLPVPAVIPLVTAPLASSSPPARLSIPSIKVDAAAESVGVDAQGRMAVPSKPDDVGWYRLGPSPGEPGNAVIDGHLDWWTGAAVFWQLARLKIGDEIVVTRADGQSVQFIVDGTTTVLYDSRPPGLFATDGPPSLSLITCSGSWDRQKQTYSTRLVVHASLAPSRPTQTPGDGG